ncbi:metal-sulfur cluster assembly factor [Companilactobacillus sp.]|jgi:metal-sulfur cluster biosynthetic enzyme|uniref:metal-sulfur cluster assembly factor n=1 Tax=Companilactobacillus sp. TaxID=2767905 RepID=UPI0025BC5848|nr:metal-sulfur cluster assembly factor [Companilactobacillus sp.]MCH4010090.1 metal-sulfur cluster assembly factor [Companilactobacillus sp.]MCH4052234.1 metal-sulfur cluster assembly factor [Companilactobacillus sp.]MCH4078032.1 metal-sulfur cluster assembly factor [Companilactobacillus sp.]MCH4126608.1 metal-sulfur cluster assembly factor [Companilactobacillus sp.]MCH4132193.1 metal-sulfur cluster assembly factor [Companilactobacillus sp.]
MEEVLGQGDVFSPIENDVMNSLESVIDPELGIDIVNLGLIYDVVVKEKDCTITMTLTTMGCPISNLLEQQILDAAKEVEGISKCQINLVWQPAWNVSMISRFGKISLGIHG